MRPAKEIIEYQPGEVFLFSYLCGSQGQEFQARFFYKGEEMKVKFKCTECGEIFDVGLKNGEFVSLPDKGSIVHLTCPACGSYKVEYQGEEEEK